jgi:hypothetical protein
MGVELKNFKVGDKVRKQSWSLSSWVKIEWFGDNGIGWVDTDGIRDYSVNNRHMTWEKYLAPHPLKVGDKVTHDTMKRWYGVDYTIVTDVYFSGEFPHFKAKSPANDHDTWSGQFPGSVWSIYVEPVKPAKFAVGDKALVRWGRNSGKVSTVTEVELLGDRYSVRVADYGLFWEADLDIAPNNKFKNGDKVDYNCGKSLHGTGVITTSPGETNTNGGKTLYYQVGPYAFLEGELTLHVPTLKFKIGDSVNVVSSTYAGKSGKISKIKPGERWVYDITDASGRPYAVAESELELAPEPQVFPFVAGDILFDGGTTETRWLVVNPTNDPVTFEGILLYNECASKCTSKYVKVPYRNQTWTKVN